MHSNFTGAKFVYENFVDEVFQKHEVDIDQSLAICKAQVRTASLKCRMRRESTRSECNATVVR